MQLAGVSLDALASRTTPQALSVAVLKKALDSQTQAALSLIEAIPTPPSSAGLPAHIGRNVNTIA